MSPVIKCKHCCSELILDGKIWYGQGVVLKDICMLSPTGRHQPKEDNDEIVENVENVETSTEDFQNEI
jgi:hypothetical protein